MIKVTYSRPAVSGRVFTVGTYASEHGASVAIGIHRSAMESVGLSADSFVYMTETV